MFEKLGQFYKEPPIQEEIQDKEKAIVELLSQI